MNMPLESHDPEYLKQLERWDREVVWHAFTQMAEYEPLIIERASGCVLIDVHGREYLDGVSSLWCNVHGHRHPRIDQAIREQLDRVAHVTSLGMSNPTTIQLAQRLVEIAPRGLAHVFFSDSGASAVEVALKIAFQYFQQRTDPQPAKTKFIAFEDAYHGDTLGSVSVGGVARFHDVFRPLLFDVLRLPTPDTYRFPPELSPDQLAAYHLQKLDATLAAHHREVVAVVMEPLVQAAAGMRTHPAGFLSGVRELTRRYDVLLIADEVAVGMGRTGRMFACEQESVTPDLLCLAKGLSGGYLPIAATLATNEIWKAFLGTYAESKTFFHGHTFGGNPLGSAAALANLDTFREERTLESVQPKIERLRLHCERLRQLPLVGDVRQCGMLAAVELVRDRETKQPFPWSERRGHQVCQFAFDRGVWIRPLGNVVVMMPPLAITLDQLDRIANVVHEAISGLTVE